MLLEGGCPSGESCCGEICCPPERCCDNDECCEEECEGCIDNGSLSGGSIAVTPDPVCIGDTITFTLSDVVDEGGIKRVNCSAKTAIPAVTPTYTWIITKPDATGVNGSGPVATVVADQPGTYFCTFTASADRECPPPDISIGPGMGVAALGEAIHVDATDPHAAMVTYSVSPGSVVIDSATFTAPGTIEMRANLTGEFSFTFDQENLLNGVNQIRLDYTIGGSTCTTEATATRTTTHAPPLGTIQEIAFFKVPVDSGLVTVPVLHSIWAQLAFICYSIDVLPASKTLWVGKAKVNISTEQAPGIPTQIAAWGETHLYRDDYGDHLEQPMAPVTGPTIPAQGPYFRTVELYVDAFFEPTTNLTAIAEIESLFFDDPSGPVMAIPFIPIANTAIDLALETNADPSVSCP